MSALWIAVIAGVLMVLIDFGWRQLERRGVHLSPARRQGSTLQTAIAAGAVVFVAWILDAAGVLGSVLSSPEARVAVVAMIIVLQVAAVLGFAVLVREKRPT